MLKRVDVNRLDKEDFISTGRIEQINQRLDFEVYDLRAMEMVSAS